MDTVDLTLVESLTAAPRAQNKHLAELVGVSEQTVSRRYRRMVAAGLRVSGSLALETRGLASWNVRLQTTPSAGHHVASALARRGDTAWIYVAAAGSEVIFNVHLPIGRSDSRDRLLHQLSGATSVVGMSVQLLLRSVRLPWEAISDINRTHHSPRSRSACGAADIDSIDRAIVAELVKDGRVAVAALARAIGEPDSTTSRRMARLHASGQISYAVDLPNPLRGRPVEARAWLRVRPAGVTRAARRLSEHPDVTFVAVTTGPTNLVASLACRDVAGLADFVTHGPGTDSDVLDMEIAPLDATIKRLTSVSAPLRT